MTRLGVATLALLNGCSFGTRGPGPKHGTEPVQCTDDDRVLLVDALGAGLSIAIGGSALADYVSYKPSPCDFVSCPPSRSTVRNLSVAFLSLAAVYSASMVYGGHKANACRRAKAEEEARSAADERARRDHEEQLEREAAARRAARARAISLTKDAAAAARSGDCASVLALDRQVAAVDLEFHDVVFDRDVGILRCLQ